MSVVNSNLSFSHQSNLHILVVNFLDIEPSCCNVIDKLEDKRKYFYAISELEARKHMNNKKNSLLAYLPKVPRKQ